MRVDNMTAGRGWIALAMVIFGTWDPPHAALEVYLFGGVQAVQLRLQVIGIAMPTYLLMMVPYAFRSGLDHRQRQSCAAAPRPPPPPWEGLTSGASDGDVDTYETFSPPDAS
jgi:hypothetical protein